MEAGLEGRSPAWQIPHSRQIAGLAALHARGSRPELSYCHAGYHIAFIREYARKQRGHLRASILYVQHSLPQIGAAGVR
jgi:hypothetical protein